MSIKSSKSERERRQRRESGDSTASLSKCLKGSKARAVSFTLDHIHRACFRPSVPSALQVEVARKLGVSRRALERNAPTPDLLKPLYHLMETFYRLGYQISDTLTEEMKKVNDSLREATEYHKEYYIDRIVEASSTSVSDVEISLLKKQIKSAQKCMKALADITEVISIVKSAINRIHRERPCIKEGELEIEKELKKDIVGNLDQMEEALKIVEAAESSKLPKEVSLPLKVSLSRARRALLSNSAYSLLRKPLKILQDAIQTSNNEDIQKAAQAINKAVDNYDSLQMLS